MQVSGQTSRAKPPRKPEVSSSKKSLLSKLEKTGKLKLDQGFKSVLRGIRKAIRADFEKSGLDVGKHHWTVERWLIKGRQYLTEYIGFENVTGYQVAAIVLLLYHAFGPSKSKPMDETSPIFIALKNEGVKRYKCIFDNNNKTMVTEFFQDEYIKMLWEPVILPNMTFELCFEKTDRPNHDIELTYREISRIMRDDFKLEMPKWWTDSFPATPFKLTKK